jgi:hypothetical protein
MSTGLLVVRANGSNGPIISCCPAARDLLYQFQQRVLKRLLDNPVIDRHVQGLVDGHRHPEPLMATELPRVVAHPIPRRFL